MNRIYKVIWSKVKHQYVVVSELAHSCTKSAGSRVGRSAAAVLAALVLTTGLCAAPVQAEDLTDPYAIVNARVKETNSTSSDTLVALVQSPLAKSVAPLADEGEGQPGEGGATTPEQPDQQPEQHTIYNEEGFYVHNQQNTYNALTKDGLWVGGDDQAVGFHVDNEGNLFTNGTATFKQGADMGGKKITNVAPGNDSTDAVNKSQLDNVEKQILTNTEGDGISVVNDAEGRTSTISVKLKDGEQNLAVGTEGLSLKPEITLDKVTSDNFTVDGANISLTNAGLVMGDTTKLTSDGLTTGKVSVGSVVLDSTTNTITGLANGSAPSDAVNMSQLTGVENKILTNTPGEGISVVNDADGKTSTISVKLKDGEDNLAVGTEGLSLKPEVTLDKVTSDNFTVDGTNISLTNAGLVMGDTTKLTSDGLTTGKVSVGSVVLDSTTNKITGLVTDGSNGSEAVSVDYLKDYVSTAGVGKAYAEGNGISIVDGIDNNPSTISVKLKDGEQNLAVGTEGLSLKPEITLDKVTSDNFTVDGTNISLTNAGLVMGDTTKLTSDGLTTGKISVGSLVLDSTTNKITGLVTDGSNGSEAVSVDYLKNYVSTAGVGKVYTEGNGISIVEGIDNNPSTISVKLKDGEQNLAVGTEGLSLKPEVTLDKVTSDNFTVDGTNISMTNAGLVMGDTTKLTSDGLTTGKVSVGSVVLDSTTNTITGLANGSAPSDAVNMSQLTGVENKILTNTPGEGISVVNDADGKTSTISVKLKDGEDNLTVGTEGLSLKPEITLDKVTASNGFMIDSATSFTSDGLKISGLTYVSADGLNANSKKITSVSKGEISATSTDAVNGSQLWDVKNVTDNAVQYSNTNKTRIELAGSDGTTITNLAESPLADNSTDAATVNQVYDVDQKVGAAKWTNTNFLNSLSDLTTAASTLDGKLGNLIYDGRYRLNSNSHTTVTAALNELDKSIGTLDYEALETPYLKTADYSNLTSATDKLANVLSSVAGGVGITNDTGVIDWGEFNYHGTTVIDTLRLVDTNLYSSEGTNLNWGSVTYIGNDSSIMTGMKNLDSAIADLDGRVDALENSSRQSNAPETKGTSTVSTDSTVTEVSAESAPTETTATESPTAATMESAMAKAPAAANSMLTRTQSMTMALNDPGVSPLSDPVPVENPNPDGSNTSNIHTEGDMTTVEKNFTVTGDATFEQGASMGGHKITNVAAGTEATDGVNYGQLQAVQNQVDTNSQNIGILGSAVNKLGDRIERVGAGAAALAALHPLDFDPDNKLDFAAGFGNYRGASAVAVGAFYRPSENVMFSVGGAFGGGEDMVNAGVSFKVGAGSGSATTSRTAMAKSLKSMQEVVASQDAQLAQQREQIDKLTAMVELLMEQNGQAQPKDGDAQAAQPQQ